MSPKEVYDAIENAWKSCAVHAMVLGEILSGRQKANPEAFTMEQQKSDWDKVAGKLRSALDSLSDVASCQSCHGSHQLLGESYILIDCPKCNSTKEPSNG
jgi:Zn finger protein HypA/HybF involved in hydrogenase expression